MIEDARSDSPVCAERSVCRGGFVPYSISRVTLFCSLRERSTDDQQSI